jgi:hypothetical protein
MSPAASSSATPAGTTDVLIVGGGPAGLSLAIALAQAGLQATVLEQQGAAALADPAPDGREIALTHPSVATLQRLGSWQRLAPHEIGLLRQAQVHDGPVGQREGMALNAQGTGCDNLGWIVPNHALRRTAWAVAAARRACVCSRHAVTRVSTTPACAELEYVDAATPDATPIRLQAPLLVAADSRFSATRRQLGIGASMHDFGRTVIVCRLRHERAHDGIAHECFGYERTLAILPLPDDPDSGARCARRWSRRAASRCRRCWRCRPRTLPRACRSSSTIAWAACAGGPAPCLPAGGRDGRPLRRRALRPGGRCRRGHAPGDGARLQPGPGRRGSAGAGAGRGVRAAPTWATRPCWRPTPAPTAATPGRCTAAPTPSSACTPTGAPCRACCAAPCWRAPATCRRSRP